MCSLVVVYAAACGIFKCLFRCIFARVICMMFQVTTVSVETMVFNVPFACQARGTSIPTMSDIKAEGDRLSKSLQYKTANHIVNTGSGSLNTSRLLARNEAQSSLHSVPYTRVNVSSDREDFRFWTRCRIDNAGELPHSLSFVKEKFTVTRAPLAIGQKGGRSRNGIQLSAITIAKLFD